MIESEYLKYDVKNIQKLLTIPTLKRFEVKDIGELLRLSKIRQYEDGECIIKEGDTDPWLYFLLSGRVRVKKAGIEIFTISEQGDLFGEMRILDSAKRSASVYADGKTVCLAVNTYGRKKHGSYDKAGRDLNFLLLLYRIFGEYVANRLRLTSEELIKAKKEIAELKNKQK